MLFLLFSPPHRSAGEGCHPAFLAGAVQSLPCLSGEGLLRTQALSDLPVGSPVFKVGVLAHRERRQPPVEVTAVFRDILPH